MNSKNAAVYVLVSQGDSDSSESSLCSQNSDQLKLHNPFNINPPNWKQKKKKRMKNIQVSPKKASIAGSVQESCEFKLSIKSTEREETIKCFFSSALFLLVIVAMVSIAIILNPQM